MRALRFLGLASALLLGISSLAACAAPTPTPKELTAQQIVAQSTDRMKDLQSIHFRLEMTDGKITVAPGIALDTLEGDAAVPDRLHIQAKATLFGMVADIELISAEGKQFLRNPISRQWQQLPITLALGKLFSPDAGPVSIMKSAKQLTKEANETIDGKDSYHIKGIVEAASIASLVGGTAASGSIPVDAWVDSNDFLVRQIKLQGAVVQDDPANIARLLKLSKFNSPVDIQLPG